MAELYRITGPSNKQYIGVTSMTAMRRFDQHIVNAQRGDVDNYFWNALAKHGLNAFKVETLVVGEEEWAAITAKRNATRVANRKKETQGTS